MKPALEEGLSHDATFQRLRDASAKEDLAKRELPGHGTDFALPAQFVKYTLRLPLALQHVLDNTLYRARHGGKEMSINEMLIVAADQAAQESGLNWVPKLLYDERNHEDLAPGVRDAILRRDVSRPVCRRGAALRLPLI